MSKIACSVGILTFNNQDTLERALLSVKDFAEIIVCDGGSTDETLQIAQRYGCKVIMQNRECKDDTGALIDFSCARNQMLEAASHEWFFFLDSDEYGTDELAGEMRKIVEDVAATPTAYWVPRKYVIDDEIIECATTYPNKQMRFFHKNAVHNFIKKIHEKIKVKEGAPVDSLLHYMLVPLDSNISSFRKRNNRYLELEYERRESLTLLQWITIVVQNSKVSLLYSYRFVRNSLLCRGKKMPFSYEWERHVYNIKLSKILFKKIRF